MAFSKRNILGLSILVSFTGLAAGCAEDSGPGGGTGGSTPGAGGSTPGAGGSTPGAGGSTPGAGGAGTGGTTGGSFVPVPSEIATDGYVSALPWSGYAYTVAEKATVTPECSDTDATKTCFVGAGMNLCANGTLEGDTKYGAFSMIGFKTDQAMEAPVEGEPNPANPWPMAGTGITIDVTNPLQTKMRLKVETPEIDPSTTKPFEYCADLSKTGGSQTVLWGAFRTQCWLAATDPLSIPLPAASNITAIAVQVPGELTAVEYGFCIINVSNTP